MRVFGWGKSSFRLELPLRELANRGADTSWSQQLPESWAVDADVIIRHIGLPATDRWRQLCAHGPRAVLDIDDDVWSIDPSVTACYSALSDPDWRDSLRRDIEASHVVTVSTPHLAEIVSEINPNVVVVPNRIPAWLLDHQRLHRADLTIGWQGSWSHRQDWHPVAPHIQRFLEEHRRVVVHVMGAFYESMLPWPRRFFTNWTDTIDDYWRHFDFDVGLAPLVDHPYNRARSPIKALEYGAFGIPIVASATGPYPDYVRHGETGFLVRHPGDWGDYLHQLATDDELRAEMGRNARRQATEHTVEANLDHWLNAWK